MRTLGPEYEVLDTLRESAWVEHAIETIKVFVHNRQSEVGAVSVYVLRKVGDVAIDWAKAQFKRHPENRRPKKIIIYGPDGSPIRIGVVKDADTVEE